jgi:hypothetical protein
VELVVILAIDLALLCRCGLFHKRSRWIPLVSLYVAIAALVTWLRGSGFFLRVETGDVTTLQNTAIMLIAGAIVAAVILQAAYTIAIWRERHKRT